MGTDSPSDEMVVVIADAYRRGEPVDPLERHPREEYCPPLLEDVATGEEEPAHLRTLLDHRPRPRSGAAGFARAQRETGPVAIDELPAGWM